MEESSPREIKKCNYYLFLVLFLFHTAMFIFSLVYFSFKDIIMHFTFWNFMICSFYIFSLFITDTCLYYFSYTKCEKFNYFMRNKYSHISFSICCAVTIIYWFIILPLALLGDNNTGNQNDESGSSGAESIILNLYIHGGVNIVLLIELIYYKRERIKYSFKTIFVIIGIFLVYSIFLIITQVVFKVEAYDLTADISAISYILLEIFLIIISFVSYSINYCVVNLINKNNNHNTELTNEENIISDEQKNNENNENNVD